MDSPDFIHDIQPCIATNLNSGNSRVLYKVGEKHDGLGLSVTVSGKICYYAKTFLVFGPFFCGGGGVIGKQSTKTFGNI